MVQKELFSIKKKEKRCSKCGEVKSVEQFHKDKTRKDGYYSWCKECSNANSRLQRQQNPNHFRMQAKKLYHKNIERYRLQAKECRNKNLERAKAKVRERYQKNPEKFRELSRRYRQMPGSKEKARILSSEWRQKNRERARRTRNECLKRRYEDWKAYFTLKYSETPICGVCGKHLDFFTGNKLNSVYWDHRNGGNEKIKQSPVTWIRSCHCTKKAISIWESCNFGILCNNCNKNLPTKNRESWLEKVSQYIQVRSDEAR